MTDSTTQHAERARGLGLADELSSAIQERGRALAQALQASEADTVGRSLEAACTALAGAPAADLQRADRWLRQIDLCVNDVNPALHLPRAPRVGIFGWGLVGPGAPTIHAFRERLERSTDTWLTPFHGFGPDNFLVGRPTFDFGDYRDWILERFEPNKFAQLNKKMGNNVLYAIGAFIQALGQNPGLEATLQELGLKTHVYVGTGVGDIPLMYKLNLRYYKAQRRWNRFWANPERCAARREYEALDAGARRQFVEAEGAPPEPGSLPAGADPDDQEEAVEAWEAFWAARSDRLAAYLEESAEAHDIEIRGDIERDKTRVIKRRLSEIRKLNERWQIPPEPWTCVSSNRIWNIDNIPAAQITMLGRIHGASFAPIGACSGFDIALGLGADAIRENRAKAVVVGMTDPAPHPLLLGAFYDARVISSDRKMSRPLEGLKGTHVAGGSVIWVLGDLDYMMNRGHQPVGCEIVATGASSDAYHIITPSRTGPRLAIQQALRTAKVTPEEVDTWDLHATATPGDWTELQNTTEMIGAKTVFTARKGVFGHGMSVGGGWELTAQHLAMSAGQLFGTQIAPERMHPDIRRMTDRIVTDHNQRFDGRVGGKINMGIGGVNGVVISRVWEYDPTLSQALAVLETDRAALNRRLEALGAAPYTDPHGVQRLPHAVFQKLLAAASKAPAVAESGEPRSPAGA